MPDPTTAYTDLEIGLTRWNADSYRVDLRVSLPDSSADVRPITGGPVLARWDAGELRSHALDPVAYGQALARGLFADERLRTAFASARAASRVQGEGLRFRLFIDPACPELHALQWETLRDPADGAPLATSERVLMARYLSSPDWQPVKLRPLGELQAVVCIANPSDLAAYEFAPVDVAGELARVRSALGAIPVTALDTPGSATLNNLIAKLRDNYDLLHLVCHGALVDGEPRPLFGPIPEVLQTACAQTGSAGIAGGSEGCVKWSD
ncbi:MAG: CHAT domain-containing protein [Anaerolineae bacterium]